MVLLVLGIGLGLVLPVMDTGLGGDALDRDVRRLRGMIMQARERAMLDGEPWRIVLPVRPSPDSVERSSGDRMTVFLSSDRIRIQGVEWPAADRYQTSGAAEITFLPNGLADPVFIHIGPDREQGRTVTLKAFNPRIRIDNGYAHFSEQENS